MKKTSLIALTSLAALSVQAQLIDQWTFNEAVDPGTPGTGPQFSEIGNDEINFWDPALTGNSHDTGAGVLTWGYNPGSNFATSGSAYLGGSWLGLGSAPEQLVLTVDAKDLSFSGNGIYRWQFTGGSGGIPTGTIRGWVQSFNDNITIRMEGTGSEFNSGILFNQNDYTSITDLQLVYTWDFANNTMAMAVTGSGELAAGGTGTISFSDSVAQDLSTVTNLTSFRTGGQGPAGSYIELDNVAITNVPEPSTAGLMAGLLAFGSMALRRRRA